MIKKLAIIGLGYVGLPLAVEFSKKFNVIGFDISETRASQLNSFYDKTNEISQGLLKKAIKKNKLLITNNNSDLSDVDCFIITVPTPIDKNKKPDLFPLLSASKMVGKLLRKGNIVVYESTVFPGATEEECVPILEEFSNLKFNKDFYCGYSPERINPGDKTHNLTSIKKITSGSNHKISLEIDRLYKTIIKAGTYKAPSIRIAEAAKVIENSQRDINIAFMNELAIIFSKLNINTSEVLKAASTKWNFLDFKPGLVGGHCIGVDPFYLTHKAQSVGYNPEIILSGRKLNDGMGQFVASELVKLIIKKDFSLRSCRILVMGVTFKENCPDIRNSKVFDVIYELKQFGLDIDIYDPHADIDEIRSEHGLELLDSSNLPPFEIYQGILIAVAHKKFRNLKIRQSVNQVIYDIKGIYNDSDLSL